MIELFGSSVDRARENDCVPVSQLTASFVL